MRSFTFAHRHMWLSRCRATALGLSRPFTQSLAVAAPLDKQGKPQSHQEVWGSKSQDEVFWAEEDGQFAQLQRQKTSKGHISEENTPQHEEEEFDYSHLRYGLRPRNSRERKLKEPTLIGKAFDTVVHLPPLLEETITGILRASAVDPQQLRIAAAAKYVALAQETAPKPENSPMEADAHVAAFFLQNYSTVYRVMWELKKSMEVKLGKPWRPNSILDVGHGPATGMVALNEILEAADDWTPEIKDAVIFGGSDMKLRARLLLQHQRQESTPAVVEYESEGVVSREPVVKNPLAVETVFPADMPTINSGKKYDLIIATHQLRALEGDFAQFPRCVDMKVDELMPLLNPEGIVVFLERGTPLGFECVARARQKLIRPEGHKEEFAQESEKGVYKQPRVWNNSAYRTREEIEEQAKISGQQFESEIFEKFGPEKAEDLAEEAEILKDFEVEDITELKPDFHVRILAPCPHHGECPLQLRDPRIYDYHRKKKRSKPTWCHYTQKIHRPKYTIELKKGKYLATPWETRVAGKGVKGKAPSGKGRKDGNDHETASYSYLVAQRMDSARVNAKDEAYLADETSGWPRLLETPRKHTGHVVMKVCAAEANLQQWTVPKSFSAGIYRDARRTNGGDLWAMGAKTKLVRTGLDKTQLWKEHREHLERKKSLEKKERSQKQHVLKLRAKAVEEGTVEEWIARFKPDLYEKIRDDPVRLGKEIERIEIEEDPLKRLEKQSRELLLKELAELD